MKPYLSIVVSARNSDAENLLIFKSFMRGIYHHSRGKEVWIELIIVEWNPLSNQPSLQASLPPPAKEDQVIVRFFQVSQSLHQRYKHSATVDFFPMIAKNVGIRRAKGEFVLCTAPNVLFSAAFFQQIAKKTLDVNSLYSAACCEVPNDAVRIEDPQEQFTFCKKNKQNVQNQKEVYRNAEKIPSIFYGFPKLMRFLNATLEIPRYLRPQGFAQKHINALNFSTCDAFTMMKKTAWLRIQGYLELELYQHHVAKMALIAAYAVGLEQKMLPSSIPIYTLSPEKNGKSLKSPEAMILEMKQQPYLHWDWIEEGSESLFKEQRTYHYNAENWGLGGVDLDEFVLGGF